MFIYKDVIVNSQTTRQSSLLLSQRDCFVPIISGLAMTVCIVFVLCLALAGIASAEDKLSGQQLDSILLSANDAFRRANAASDSAESAELYQKAILSYEKIINEGKIHNAKLYYNLANAYFLNEQLGKAILNYRRAEQLDGGDTNIQKNLVFAQSKRSDSFEIQTKTRVLQTLFFWHYDFSLKTRFVLTCIFFAAVCLIIAMMIWRGKNTAGLSAAVILAFLCLCMLTSVLVSEITQSKTVYGVITASDVVARQGDGTNYPPSFKQPLHEGTEFDLLEQRPGWFHIKLPDNSDAWIPQSSAEII